MYRMKIYLVVQVERVSVVAVAVVVVAAVQEAGWAAG